MSHKRLLAAALLLIICGVGLLLIRSDDGYDKVYAQGNRVWFIDSASLKDTPDSDGTMIREGWVVIDYKDSGLRDKIRYHFHHSRQEYKTTDSMGFDEKGQATEV